MTPAPYSISDGYALALSGRLHAPTEKSFPHPHYSGFNLGSNARSWCNGRVSATVNLIYHCPVQRPPTLLTASRLGTNLLEFGAGFGWLPVVVAQVTPARPLEINSDPRVTSLWDPGVFSRDKKRKEIVYWALRAGEHY